MGLATLKYKGTADSPSSPTPPKWISSVQDQEWIQFGQATLSLPVLVRAAEHAKPSDLLQIGNPRLPRIVRTLHQERKREAQRPPRYALHTTTNGKGQRVTIQQAVTEFMAPDWLMRALLNLGIYMYTMSYAHTRSIPRDGCYITVASPSK